MIERIRWNHHIRSWLKLDRYTLKTVPGEGVLIVDSYTPSKSTSYVAFGERQSLLIPGKVFAARVSSIISRKQVEKGGKICKALNKGYSVCSGCYAVLKDYEPPQDENLLPICYQCKSPVYYSQVQNKGK